MGFNFHILINRELLRKKAIELATRKSAKHFLCPRTFCQKGSSKESFDQTFW